MQTHRGDEGHPKIDDYGDYDQQGDVDIPPTHFHRIVILFGLAEVHLIETVHEVCVDDRSQCRAPQLFQQGMALVDGNAVCTGACGYNRPCAHHICR